VKQSPALSSVFRLVSGLTLCLCSAGLLCRPAVAQDLASDSSDPAVSPSSAEVVSAAADPAIPLDTPAPASTSPQTAAPRADRCDIISAGLRCLDDILHDQVGIWTAPRRIHRRDAIWLVPLAGAVAVSLTYDTATMNALGTPAGRIRFSNDFSDLGSGYTLAGTAGAFYVVGRLTHNERAR
jgi:hypothetical protein